MTTNTAARRGSTGERLGAFATAVTCREYALVATAVMRIGYGVLFSAMLLRQFFQRDTLWGPHSPWTVDLSRVDQSQVAHWLGLPFAGWHSVLTLDANPAYFEVIYVAAIGVGVLFALGVKTRLTAWLFLVAVASFFVRNPFVIDGGDKILMLMAIYLPFTDCGRRLSFDARQAARSPSRAEASQRASAAAAGTKAEFASVAHRLVTLTHNCAVLGIAAQMCFVYGTAGLLKVQGSLWQNGTALAYVLNLRDFQVWPALSHWISANTILVALASYAAVILQVGFPFAIFSQRLKYVVLLGLVGMHLGIAVLLGLPAFSAAMLLGDAIFVSDDVYLAWLGRLRGWMRRRSGVTLEPSVASRTLSPDP